MRKLSAPLKSHIESGVTTLCRIWTLTRKDGTVFGFTDHDEDLRIDGQIYSAQSGLSAGGSDASLGFAIDNGALQSLLTDKRITADDINAGLYDSAALICTAVNWQDLSQRADIARGQLGEITQKGTQFEAEWIGEGAKLDRSQGRVFSRMCSASFGDAQCGLNAADYPEGTLCPRSFFACKNQFGNSLNFRGFPFLLGNDALTSAPQETDLRDGGSRYGSPISGAQF